MFDTHAHLDDEKFDGDRESIINALRDDGVSLVVNAGADISSSLRGKELAEKYPFIYFSAGVHPHDAKYMTENDLETIKTLLSHEKCVALGEIGLDFYYDNSERDTQRFWFKKQLELARDINIPVIIHDRDAHAECFEYVKSSGVRGVFHCYSGSAEMAEELVRIGFYISFTGAVTFKNAKKSAEVIAKIPLEKILIETDSPYLSPEPFRGKRNEPKNVLYVAQKIAEIKNETLETIINKTEENGKRLFKI